MREKNRKPIASYIKLPQFTTMNVIDGQAGLIIYASLIFYSLTIDNILNIIVLLILAGVTIQTLTGDNGLLDKAKSAVDKYSEGEICEQIKLAYSEYQMLKFTNNDSNLSSFLKTKMESLYGVNSTEVISASNFITLRINRNGKSKIFSYNVDTEEVNSIPAGIQYGNKTIDTINVGDDITIGTERFKVFYAKSGKIKAMPYYNLMLSEGLVKQSSEDRISSEFSEWFASTNYWAKTENWDENAINKGIDIDMSDSRNNIQQHITDYKNVLEKFGAEGIEVRIALKSDLEDEGVTDIMRNAGGKTGYWVGTAYPRVGEESYWYDKNMYYVNNKGEVGVQLYYMSYGNRGTRPIIIIE